MVEPQPKSIYVWIGETRYASCYVVHDGTPKTLEVFGAYGSRKVPLGRRKPEPYAEALLEEIVREWLTERR